jgi:hypothetical protein
VINIVVYKRSNKEGLNSDLFTDRKREKREKRIQNRACSLSLIYACDFTVRFCKLSFATENGLDFDVTLSGAFSQSRQANILHKRNAEMRREIACVNKPLKSIQ